MRSAETAPAAGPSSPNGVMIACTIAGFAARTASGRKPLVGHDVRARGLDQHVGSDDQLAEIPSTDDRRHVDEPLVLRAMQEPRGGVDGRLVEPQRGLSRLLEPFAAKRDPGHRRAEVGEQSARVAAELPRHLDYAKVAERSVRVQPIERRQISQRHRARAGRRRRPRAGGASRCSARGRPGHARVTPLTIMFATAIAATSEFWAPIPDTVAGRSTSTLPRSGRDRRVRDGDHARAPSPRGLDRAERGLRIRAGS